MPEPWFQQNTITFVLAVLPHVAADEFVTTCPGTYALNIAGRQRILNATYWVEQITDDLSNVRVKLSIAG